MQLELSTIITVGSIVASWASAIGYMKSRIDALTEQVKKQNSNVADLQKWTTHHLEDCHAK